MMTSISNFIDGFIFDKIIVQIISVPISLVTICVCIIFHQTKTLFCKEIAENYYSQIVEFFIAEHFSKTCSTISLVNHQ